MDGVKSYFYRPGNSEVELGIGFFARNRHEVAFYIFGGSTSKKLVLRDITDNRDIWYI